VRRAGHWIRDGFVAAYELASGKQRWRIARDEGLSWSTPGVVELGGVKQVVFNSSKWVRAHDPRDGREIWRLNNEAKGAWDRVPTPFAAGGLIIVAGACDSRWLADSPHQRCRPRDRLIATIPPGLAGRQLCLPDLHAWSRRPSDTMDEGDRPIGG
jgi:hypothetical protein